MYKGLFEEIFLKAHRPYAWLCLMIFTLYAKTIAYGFCFFDDKLLIVDNHAFIGNILNIWQAFKENPYFPLGQSSYYRPLMVVSLMLDAQLGGVRPMVYHCTNILLHAVATCLLFYLFTKLNYRKTLAFAFALLFAVHPVNTQAVSWIFGRNDSLLAVFAFASFIFLVNYENTGKCKYLVLQLLSFAAALCTKETAVALVPLYFLYRHLASARPLKAAEQGLMAAGWIGLSIAWLVVRSRIVTAPDHAAALAHSAFFNLSAVLVYVGKTAFPFNLSVIPMLDNSPLFFGVIASVLVAALVVLSKSERPRMQLFGAVWFILFLIPTLARSNAVPAYYMLENRLYAALPGLFLLLMETGVVKTLFSGNRGKWAVIAAGPVMVLFSVVTFIHSTAFMNPVMFWKNALQYSPDSPAAHKHIGTFYFEAGQADLARQEFEKVIALPINDPDARAAAHNYLGLIHLRANEPAKAAEEFREGLELRPEDGSFMSNLAIAYSLLNDEQRAASLFNRALRCRAPSQEVTLGNLASLYYQNRDYARVAAYTHMLRQQGGIVPPKIQQYLEQENKRRRNSA